MQHSERTAKYNRLMKIEAELGSKAVFRGMAALPFGVKSPSSGPPKQIEKEKHHG